MATVFNGIELAGDLLKRYQGPEYCFKSVKLIADTLTATDLDIAGQPVLDNGDGTADLLLNASVAGSANAVIVQHGKLSLASAATTTEKFLILVRGPAVVHTTGYPAVDAGGNAFTAGAAMTTMFEDEMAPAVVVNTPATTKTEIQTT